MPQQLRTFFSRQNILIILFSIASHNEGQKGFKGRFNFVNKTLYTFDGELLTDTVCDQQFLSISSSTRSTTSGRFASPFYPSKYASNSVCAFHFMGKYNEKVKIVFDKIAFGNIDMR